MKDQEHGAREVVHYSTTRMTYVVVNGYCVKILDPCGSVIPDHPMLGARLDGSVTSQNLTVTTDVIRGHRLKFQEGLITWFTDPVTDIFHYAAPTVREPKRDHPSGTRPVVTPERNPRAFAS